MAVPFIIPAGIVGSTTAIMRVKLVAFRQTYEPFLVAVYSRVSSNTPAIPPPYDGGFYDLGGARGASEGTAPPVVGTIDIPVDIERLKLKAGMLAWFIFGTNNELTNGGDSSIPSPARASSYDFLASEMNVYPQLIIT